MTHFTPIASAIGGVLIGMSAAWLWLSLGRIAGISGILGGLLPHWSGDAWWRLAFLIGLIGGPLLVAAVFQAPDIVIKAGPSRLVIAGLLVGLGTRLGSGCTSGHGVCGIARLSPRSLAATGTFMAVAGVTVFVMRHLVGG